MSERSGTGTPPPAPERRFRTLSPGRLPYRKALALQESLLEERLRTGEDVLLLLEHPPVITLGRRADPGHLLLSPEEFDRRGIERVAVGRGGEVTYHGPGQLVGYPIVHLDPLGRDLHRYLRLLETMLIDTLEAFGVPGMRLPSKTGVWVEGAKIAAIGVGVRRWVAWHGFALNVADDLSGFATIVPCGMPNAAVTSLERLLGQSPPLAKVQRQVIRSFARTFSSRHAGDYEPPSREKTFLAQGPLSGRTEL